MDGYIIVSVSGEKGTTRPGECGADGRGGWLLCELGLYVTVGSR